MKKWVALLFVCIFANSFSQTNISPQFSELKGMEDQLGNTQLFYRIYSETYGTNSYSRNDDIYRLAVGTLIDTLFLIDYLYSSPVMEVARFVYDYDFWGENFSEYIFCGMKGFGYESTAYIERFDGNANYYQWGEVNDIDISQQDDSVVYAGGDIFSTTERTIKSSDGGWNWFGLTNSPKFISLTPFNHSLLFAVDAAGNLFKSTDGGVIFSMVDTVGNSWYNEFAYDSDDLHIYRIAFENFLNFLIASNDQGAAYSWQTKYSSDSDIFISVDESISGTIYLADKKNIFVSTDYGNNFSFYKTLDRKIVGIFKKPNSNKLYAATKYKIYEITLDTIQVIKSLPAIDDFQWYPLSIGNKWVFENYRQEFDPPGIKEFIGISIMEVIGDTLINSQNYYKLTNEPLYWNIDVGLIRQDTLNAKMFIYLPEENEEVLYEDFLAQVGDTIWIDSIDYKILQNEEPFSVWGVYTYKKIIDYQFRFQGYELVKDIGLYEWEFSDFFAKYTMELKGCIVDGVIYGDTSLVVSLKNEKPPIANEFKLEQNYPNPFNQSTVISYQLPVGCNVTLKIYDVLGNEVATLVDEYKPTGEYEVTFDSHSGEVRNLVSGIYFYQLKAGNFIQTKKMVLLK